MEAIRVLVVGDYTVVRKGLEILLSSDPTIEMAGEARNGEEAVRQVEELQPDVVLMDLGMQDADKIQAIRQIKSTWPTIRIIVLAMLGNEAQVLAAVEAGADGYLSNEADTTDLLRAIRIVKETESLPARVYQTDQLVLPGALNRLTPREKEILRLIARGLSNKAISQALDLSQGTVKVHVSNILGKLRVTSRTEAALRALQAGLISVEENIR